MNFIYTYTIKVYVVTILQFIHQYKILNSNFPYFRTIFKMKEKTIFNE